MTTTSRPDYSSIALIDLSYLFTRNYRAAGVKAPPNAGANRTLDDIKAIADDVDHVILCLDGPPYLRRDRFEAYKAHREEPPHEEIMQKRELIAELKRRGYTAAKVKGFEADDIIATLSRVYAEQFPEVRIYGPDKDVAQCIRANVIQIIPSSGKRQTYRRDAKKCQEEFGALPSQMAIWQAMVGDGADGVPGVKGIGPAKATTIIREMVAQNRPVTLEGLANALAEQKAPTKEWQMLANDWNSLKLSLDLVTLDANVPLDADALLVKREPEADVEEDPEVGMHMFEGNTTPDTDSGVPEDGIPLEEAPSRPQPRIGKDPNADDLLRQQAIARGDDVFGGVCPDGYSPTGEVANGRSVFRKNRLVAEELRLPPKDEPAPAAQPPAPANDAPPARASGGAPVQAPPPPKPASEALVRTASPADVAALLAAEKYGGANAQLQPCDLRGAWTISNWIAKSGLYTNFDSPEKVFVLVQRAAEMGIPVGVALSGFHIIERKLSASADFIRALAERDDNFVYMRRVESSATRAVWETKHKLHPEVDTYEYTIEEARQVESLWRLDRHGKPGNWVTRPRDMLSKTAASKLAREVYPAAVMGLYCPEELGNGIIETVGVAA